MHNQHLFMSRALIMSLWLITQAMLPAQAQQPSSPVAPFGFALGSATRQSVLETLKGKTTVTADGTNRYSGGPMYTAPGGNLGIEDLVEATFIFDSNDRLVSVVLTFPKGGLDRNFGRLYEHLNNKYRLAQKKVPFVGDKYARYEEGPSIIELTSRHLGFSIEITYMTTGFEQAYNRITREQAAAKKKREGEKF